MNWLLKELGKQLEHGETDYFTFKGIKYKVFKNLKGMTRAEQC